MHLTFNELTFGGCADHAGANRAFDRLQQAVAGARLRGVSVAIRVRSDFWQQPLYGNVTFSEFVNSRSREEKAWLRRAVTGLKFAEDYVASTNEEFEFSSNGRLCTGLGIAFLEDSLTVGLNPPETSQRIPLTVVRVREPADLTESQVEVGNLADGDCVALFESEIRRKVLREFKSGEDVLARSAEVLSYLEFCSDAERVVRSLAGSESVFAHVAEHLYQLNFAASMWSSGRLADGLSVRCSEESNATLQKFGRQFTCPDGSTREFSWHTKIGPLSWRIHFFHDTERNRVLVGYIGRHLPTVSSPK